MSKTAKTAVPTITRDLTPERTDCTHSGRPARRAAAALGGCFARAEKPERETFNARHSAATGYSWRRPSTQAKVTSSGRRRTPWLFSGCRAPPPGA